MLNDAIAYYWSRPERVCTDADGKCLYFPPKGSQSEGCAIGRLLPPKLAIELDKQENTAVGSAEIFNKLPEWMQKLGTKFLTQMQFLHDTKVFADKDVAYLCSVMCGYVNVDEIIFPND